MAKKQRDPPAQLPPSSPSSGEEELSSSSDQEQTRNSSIPHPKKPTIQNKNFESEESSDDEENEDENPQLESSDDEEDEDENPQLVKKPTSNSFIPHSKKPPIQNKKSESEEESRDDEDDEDENPQPAKKPTSNSTIPHHKKSPVQNQKSKSEEDSSDDEEDDDDEKPQPVKMPKTSTSEKKMMTSSKLPIPNKSNGKSPIVRIWSVDDEIVILQAMLDHQSNNGHIELNATGVKDLHDSIKKNLSIDIDIAKFVEKIRRMRKKYMGASKKGANLKFAKAHDKTIYDLSDKVWGKKEEEEAGFVVNSNSRGASVSKGKSLKREFPFIRDALGGNKLALEMLETVDVKKVAALEENFKKLKAAELNVTWEVYKLLR